MVSGPTPVRAGGGYAFLHVSPFSTVESGAVRHPFFTDLMLVRGDQVEGGGS